MGDATCTVAYVIKTCNTKYQYFEGSDVWNKSSNKDTEVIALTKALNFTKGLSLISYRRITSKTEATNLNPIKKFIK